MAGKQQTHYEIDMCNGPILSKMLRFSIPLMCSSVLQLLFNAADIVVVGRWAGDNSLAAVGSNTALIGLLTNLFVGLAVGANTLAAKYYGARDRDALHRVVHTSILLSIISGLVLTVVGVFGARTILIWMQTPENVLDLATLYLRIYFLGMTATMVYNFGAALLRAEGDTQRPLYFLSLAGVVNIVLNLFFVIVCKLDVAGVAIATVISQCLSAAFVVFFLTKKSELKLRFLHKNEIPECTGHAKNILSLGAAGFIMQLTNSLVTICCNNILSVTGGDIYISVMTIISSVRQLVETPIHAMVEGTSPILSYNYGARRPGRVRKSILIMSLLVFGYTAVMWSMIILIPETLIRIFSSDAALIQDAVPALNMYFAAFIFMDLQYIGQAVFKSLNKKVFAIFFSLLRKVFIVVPLTYFLPYAMHMGTDGVFLAEPVSNVIGGTACILTMLITIMPELKRIEVENRRDGIKA